MIVLAHRGASGFAPENTIAAFQKAIEKGADGFELDVQLTKDNQLIIHHDFELGRTTTGEGFIKDLSLSYIKEQDAGSWLNEHYKGEKVPTLDEFFEFVPKGLLINLEIKTLAIDDRDIAKYVVECIKKHQREDDCIISSFNHTVLEKVQKYSTIRTGALVYSRLLSVSEYFKYLPVYSAHLAIENTDAKIIREIQNAGVKVFVWTVNLKETAEMLKKYGVDGVITNYPGLIK